MHNCEVAPPPATGANLLLELGELIVHSRSPSPPPLESAGPLPASPSRDRATTSTPEDGYGRLLQAKLLAARSLTPELPSTSKETSEEIFKRNFKSKDFEGWSVAPGLDAAAVGEAVTNAQRALYLDSQLNSHVQALWSKRVPIRIDVLLTSGCHQCGGGAGDTLLLERWSLAVKAKKSVEEPSFITSQWLLNAVRSQLHFSQISAWRAKLRSTTEPTTDPQERQRRRSREKCNYKKLESNCDEAELAGAGGDCRDDKELRKLNIIYRPGLGGDTCIFQRPPTAHRFPLTDIATDLFLEVLLESLPRTDEVPSVKCACNTLPKRRMSKDNTIHEELASRMNDLTLGPPDRAKQYRTKGATFSPDLGLINSNIGCSSGISRKLSIFSTGEYGGRVTTPERQFYDSGYAEASFRSSPSKDRKSIQLDHPYFNRNLSVKSEVRANYLLVDDRMHTPCSENGKHRCSCDEESDHGKEMNQRSSINIVRQDEGRKVLDERRLKEIAKYKRRLRKESKLKKMRESGTSDSAGTSESADRSPEKEKEEISQTTSIAILQASRFDRMRTIGCYRNRTYLTLPASRSEERRDAIDTVEPPPAPAQCAVACASTQTDDVLCACGRPVELECGDCSRRMVRSNASYDLTKVSEPPDAARLRRKEMDDFFGDEKAMKKHKCDNNVRNIKCDFSFSNLKESVTRKNMDDASNTGIIKRPKLRRVFPITERMTSILADRRKAEIPAADISELLLKDDDTAFASAPIRTDERSPLTRSSTSDDDYFPYEKCDYGTFDRFDNPESLVRDESDDDKRERTSGSAEGVDVKKRLDLKTDKVRIRGVDVPEVPSPSEMEGFRWRLDSAASMVFHARTGLPLTSSPAPLRRGKSCFDYDSSITDISGIKSALFHPVSPPGGWWSPGSSPGSPAPLPASPPPAPLAAPPPPRRHRREQRVKIGPTSGLLGTFEESALNGRLEPVATVHGFTAELGASGAFCPPHRRLPVTVFFYALGGTNAPYLGHINLGSSGYRIPRSGTVQVSLFNPHGTLVKMFVVLYELTDMPACARTFLRQRTLYVPCDVTSAPPPHECYRWLRYLIHLRFLTSKTGKLYLHTDIRIIVSRKADLDTATAHSPIYNNLRLTTGQPTNHDEAASQMTNHNSDQPTNYNNGAAHDHNSDDSQPTNHNSDRPTNHDSGDHNSGASQPTNHNTGTIYDHNYGASQPINHSTGTSHDHNYGASYNHNSGAIQPTDHNSGQAANHNSGQPNNHDSGQTTNRNTGQVTDHKSGPTDDEKDETEANRKEKSDRDVRSGCSVSRVFGGCDDCYDVEQRYDYNSAKSDRDFLAGKRMNRSEACMQLSTHCDEERDSQNVSYELRSFTYAPDNPKYSPL